MNALKILQYMVKINEINENQNMMFTTSIKLALPVTLLP